MAIATTDARHDPREGRGGRAARLRGRPRAARVGRPARARRARRPRAAAARRDDERLLRPEPLPEPDERLPREVQVLRVRGDAEAGATPTRLRRRRARRGRAPPARARPASPRSTWSAARTRTSTSTSTSRRSRSCTRRLPGRAPQVLHGERDPPHDEALRAHARGGAARAPGGRPRLAARRRRGGLRRPRAAARRARQGAPGRLVPRRTTPRTASASRRTARCSTATSRRTRSASTTCCACATSRTRPAASSRSSRSRSIPRTPSSSGAAGRHTTGADDLKMIAVVAPDARQHPERQGVLDHDGHAARAGRAALRRERRPGHGRARGDLPRRRRDAPGPSRRSTSSCGSSARPGRMPVQRDTLYNELRTTGDPARPHRLREHGAGLLPARRGRRGGAGRADRAQPAAARRRDRPRADLVDRVRAQRRPAAPPAAALRLVGGRGRLDPARLARCRSSRCASSRSRRRARPRSC